MSFEFAALNYRNKFTCLLQNRKIQGNMHQRSTFFERSNNPNYCIIGNLKGKFSSGIEGALASTLNHNFNWKPLSEIILCNFFFYVFKVYLSNIGSGTAEI